MTPPRSESEESHELNENEKQKTNKSSPFLQDAFADANGAVPAAFRDTLRYLSARGLRTPGLFSTLPDARKAS